MKILVTGACGYKGTVLTQSLLAAGHQVTGIDTQWFGNFLEPHPTLNLVKKDVRHISMECLSGVNVVIHLANIANDPSVDLNPTLSWEVNVLATQQLTDMAARSGVRQFIYASSGSVYGIKREARVTEDLPLVPLSAYNKTKMVAERVALSFKDHMSVHCLRPATVCGWSPRMRLDVAVNLLTMQALTSGIVTVFGGDQMRPNLHIRDAIRAYHHFLNNPDLPSGSYNVGFENLSIRDIAHQITKKIPAQIVTKKSEDLRSYRQDSTKILATGFDALYTVDDAIDELAQKYHSGELVDRDNWHSVRRLKQLNL